MSETQRPRQIGRSIVAVIGGILAGVILTILTDMALHAAGIFPPLGQSTAHGPFALATAYRIVFGILGSYVIALLAPNRPMQHALVGGLASVIVNTVGAIATWNRGLSPHWYPIALIVISMPCAWIGGKLYLARARMQPAQ